MKLIFLFLAAMVVSSSLVDLRTLALGGIYGQQQQQSHHNGKGKVIEGYEKEKINTKNNVEKHRGVAEEHKNVGVGSFRDNGNRKEGRKFKHVVGHA